MSTPNQKKSNLASLKFLLPLFFIALLNVNCDHCDDEDLSRQEEEVITAQHQQSEIGDKKK